MTLAIDLSPGDLKVDCSVPIDEIYTDLARHCIFKNGSNLGILGYCTGSPDPNIPSWGPDWRDYAMFTPFLKSVISPNDEYRISAYSAGGDLSSYPITHQPGKR